MTVFNSENGIHVEGRMVPAHRPGPAAEDWVAVKALTVSPETAPG